MTRERSLEEGLSDDQFWADFYSRNFPEPEPDDADLGVDEHVVVDLSGERHVIHCPSTCSICGATGACGFDSEGRPLIHAEEEDLS